MAHVGVGVIGKEGQQAVNNADYAIGRFKFLSNLLLVHGRFNYMRISTLICFMFFKNIMLVLVQFWFTLGTGFSGQKFYPELGTQGYNTIFTAAPIICFAIFDRDVGYDTCLKYPKLFTDSMRKTFFTHATFWTWMLYSFIGSLFIFYFSASASDSTFGGFRGIDSGKCDDGCFH
jgi:phospholipid-transporting ATPase